MTWNHRVFKNDRGTLSIREVYYHDNGTPDAYTTEAVAPEWHETLGELRWELEQMLKACKRPILSKADFEPSSSDEGAI